VTVLTGAQADSADWRQFWRWQLWHVWTCLQPQLPLHVAKCSHQCHGRRPSSWCAGYCKSFGLCYTAVFSSDGALSHSPAWRLIPATSQQHFTALRHTWCVASRQHTWLCKKHCETVPFSVCTKPCMLVVTRRMRKCNSEIIAETKSCHCLCRHVFIPLSTTHCKQYLD